MCLRAERFSEAGASGGGEAMAPPKGGTRRAVSSAHCCLVYSHRSSTNHIVKFPDDMTVIGPISYGVQSVYRMDSLKCGVDPKVTINVDKMKERVISGGPAKITTQTSTQMVVLWRG